jgi:hypothetical protein
MDDPNIAARARGAGTQQPPNTTTQSYDLDADLAQKRAKLLQEIKDSRDKVFKQMKMAQDMLPRVESERLTLRRLLAEVPNVDPEHQTSSDLLVSARRHRLHLLEIKYEDVLKTIGAMQQTVAALGCRVDKAEADFAKTRAESVDTETRQEEHIEIQKGETPNTEQTDEANPNL